MKAIKLSYEAINAIVTSIIKYKEANFSFDEEKQVLTLDTDPEKEKYTENEISLFHNFVFLKEVKIKVLEDQPAIVNNGDSKKAILNYNGNKIEFEGAKSGYTACERALKKFERVFAVSGIDLSDLANYMQEKYVF